MSHSSTEELTPEQLQEQIEEKWASSQNLQKQVEAMKLRNQLEAEEMQQQQWELAIQQLKHSREQMAQQHEENMKQIWDMGAEAPKQNQAVAWLQSQIPKAGSEAPNATEDQQKKVLLD